MVYRGPSKGCKKCRTRRVKCDQGRPSCGNCIKQKHSCPGYEDLFSHRHRDETAKTVERSRASITVPKHICAPSINPDITSGGNSSAFQVELTASAASAQIPPTLVPDTIALALDFFFIAYCTFGDDDATSSIFHLLPGMYARCEWGSPLWLATRALAANVTGLWALRGSDIPDARRLYSRAITRVKTAVVSPLQNQSDELLIATQVLEAYETINREHPQPGSVPVSRGLHASGSAALLKHRGALNNQSGLARQIALAVRRRLIQDAITGQHWMGETQDIVRWKDDDDDNDNELPRNPASAVDGLALKLFQLRRLWWLSAGGIASLVHFSAPGLDRNSSGGSIFSHATALHDECTRWFNDLPDRWRPTSVHHHDVDESVKAAGMHGTTCHVYANLSIASTWNWHRIIEFGVLQLLLHMRLGIVTSVGTSPVQVSEIVARMQAIVDDICASVPYCTGDITCTHPSSPLLGPTIGFPRVLLPPSPSAIDPSPRTLPESILQHEQQLASSGAVLMYRTLTTVIGMIDSQDTRANSSQALRPGQEQWMRSQISRLHRALHPVVVGRG